MPLSRPIPPRFALPIAILVIGATLGACRPADSDDPANGANAADEPVLNIPAVPVPEPALDRAGLLAAVAQAASATALGRIDPADQRRLDGRQFELRIRFGCRGPSEELGETWLGWAHDPQKQTLRVRARPTISAEDPMAAAVASEAVEAVEGFWIPRPWLMEAACPAGAATARPANPQEDDKPADQPKEAAVVDEADQPPEPVPTAPRVGIAQFFTAEDPRTGRRDDRAYQAVKTLKPEEPIGSRGFDLVLSGRLQALPGGRVINCTTKSFDQPPECLVSARFDRVWIDQPDTGEMIAEWRAQ